MESDLAVLEEFFGQFLAHHELTLAVAHRDGELLAHHQAGQPRGIGGAHTRGNHLGDVAVDVVAEEGGRCFGHLAQAAVRQQAGFHEGLETVADAQDEAAAIQQGVYLFGNLGIVEHVGNELAAAIGFVTGRETARQRQDVALFQGFGHFIDRPEDVFLRQVAEHAETHLGALLPEGFRGIVIAVGSRENGDIDHRRFHFLAGIFQIGLASLERLLALHSFREDAFEIGLAAIGIDLRPTGQVGVHQLEQIHRSSVDVQHAVLAGGDMAEQDRVRIIQRAFRLNDDAAGCAAEEIFLGGFDLHAEGIAEGHFAEGFRRTVRACSKGRYDVAGLDLAVYEIPVGLELFHIGHPVVQRGVADQVEVVAFPFQFRRDDRSGIHRGDTEGHQGGRNVNVFEGAAHGILAADGRKAEGHLHLQGTQQGRQRLAPGVGIGRHPFKIFLVGETHAFPVAAGGHHLGAGFHHRIGGAVIGAPGGQPGVVPEGHHTGRVGVAVGRQFLDRYLGLRGLEHAAIGHQHGRAADGAVEHFHQAFLRADLRVCHQAEQFLFQCLAVEFFAREEGLLVFHGTHDGAGIVLGAGAVDEAAGQVGHAFPVIEHAHVGGIRYLGHMGGFDVFLAAELAEGRLVLGFDDHGHPFLGFADGQFRGVQAAVFGGHAVQPDVQTVGQFADGDAHAARTEVVRFLDEPGYLGTAEEPLQFAFFRRITLLDLAAAGFEGGLGMLLG